MAYSSVSQLIGAMKGAVVPFAQWREVMGVSAGPARAKREKVVEGDFRPEILVPGGERRVGDFADELGALVKGKGLFLRVGEVWRWHGREGKLRLLDAETLAGWIENHVAPVRWDEVEEDVWEKVPTSVGKSVMGIVLKMDQFQRHLPRVRWISQVPLPIVRDGVPILLTSEGDLPGYHAEQELLVMPGVVIDEKVSAVKGVEWLTREVLGEFPFWRGDVERSLAVVLAGMLTGFCQLLLPYGAQRPVFIVVANAERSGKTLLVRFMLCPLFGRAEIMTPPSGPDDKEVPKALAALAFEGASYAFFDNCKEEIGGGALEAAVTASVLKARILGNSEMKSAPNDLVYFFTGNRARITPDMRGRSLVVELFVDVAQPEMREVRNWVDENGVLELRGRILSVLWAIVREWVGDGCRKGSGRHGTFQAWADVIGGMVERLGMKSPVAAPCLRNPVEPDLAAFDVLLPLVMEEAREQGRTIDPLLMGSRELMEKARGLGAFGFLSEVEPDDDKAKRAECTAWGRRVERFEGLRFPCGCMMEWTDHASRSARKLKISGIAKDRPAATQETGR